jgi:nicotinamidase-related amidase
MRQIEGIPFYDRLEEILAPTHTALIVVDMQNDFCMPGGHFARHGRDVARIGVVVPRIQSLIASARQAGVMVVYTQQVTLPGLTSDTPAWIYFKTRDGKSPDYTIGGTWGAEFIEPLRPDPDVTVVEKHRPSAFLGTDLDRILRAHRVETVVVAGCLTQGCVQATTTDASYHDYYAIVAGDCVESTSAALHENAMTFLRSRYDVVTADAIAAIWAREAAQP